MAGSLIETLSGDFDPSQYQDGYREALQKVIEAKVEGREVVRADEDQPTSGTVVDLMAALRASVEAAKQKRPGPAEDAAPATKVPATKVPATRTPATKAPAKKAPAKKAAAKKAPAKRAPRKTA